MRIGIPRETTPGERRVALIPDTVGRLVKAGSTVVVERGAGEAAGFLDAAYEAAGAQVTDAASVWSGPELVAKVRRPTAAEAGRLGQGTILIALLQPSSAGELLDELTRRRVTALALERVPRITRAQSMDVLSSQATVAGYKAALVGAAQLPRFLPMLTTAAGSIAPARAFIIGAGVAGLQAIATARRLGAVVSAFDVRPAAREQVLSLGASFVAAELAKADAEAAGGYAREQSADEQVRVARAIAGAVKDADLVITSAQIPGRPAPRLITDEMVATMRPGGVIVDLAAESGGNCALTRADETVVAHGVTILGPTNLPATVPLHASQMLSRNIHALLQHLVKDGRATIDLADEITGAMVVTHAGERRKS